MANALKILSVLLSYPSKDLIDAKDELYGALALDHSIDDTRKGLVRALIDDLVNRDVYDAEERYVMLFDRTRSLSLHLFEHIHGESRDRGQAMVDLAAMYEAQGFHIDSRELPDYLPLFLEYLSTQSAEEVANLLGQTRHVIAAIRERLQKRGSIYANAFLVLESLTRTELDTRAVAALVAEPEDDPNDLEALDRIWQEEVVTFGGNAGEAECGPDRLARQIRASRRPAAQSGMGDH